MQANTQVGPYNLLREVGRGGLGTVFEAIDSRNGQRVALKQLRMADPHISKRLEREFRAISRLEHPGLVRVYDYGSFQDSPYLIMDFIEGVSLLEYLRDHPVGGLDETVRLVADLCAVLGYVHSMGIIHRDIKPSNVLVTQAGQLKLIDFGLVKDQAEEDSLTETGMIVGTAGYFSPEQLQGRRVDGRSDLYSLGILLFELCTGRRPFISTSRLALLRAHISEAPPRPRSLNPAIPEVLEALILQLLEKEPYRRVGTALEVEARLRLLLEMGTTSEAVTQRMPIPPELFIVQAPLIGRTKEVGEIHRRLDLALRRTLQILCITGEAGAGKTRLAEEAVAHWRLSSGMVVQARSHLGDRKAYGLLHPVAKQLSGLGPTRDSATDGSVDLQEGPEFVRSVQTVLREAVVEEPILLLLEDIHWSDPLSLEALHGILRVLQEEPGKGLVVLFTFRQDEGAPAQIDRLLRWARHENILERMTLPRLTEAQSAELISVLLGSDVNPYFAAWLHRVTGGNPALLDGAVRHVLARGSLKRGASGLWRLELRGGIVQLSEFEEAQLPSALELLTQDALELAQLKLSALESTERDLLDVAALLRGEFGLETLAGVLGLDDLELLDRLDGLLRKGILAEANAEGDRFHFALEMMRESVAHALTGPKRLLLERRIVAGLERRHGLHPKGSAVIDLAEHAFSARLEEKALRYSLVAAVELERQNLFRDAERLYERIQEMLKKESLAALISPAEQHDALEGLAKTKNSRGEHTEAFALFDQLIQICEATGDRTRLLRAVRGKARAALRLQRHEVALPLVQQQIELCRELGDARDLGHALNLEAILAFDAGDLVKAEDGFRAASEAFRQTAGTEELAGSLNNIGFIVDCGGRYEEARAFFEEALQLRRQAPPNLALVRSLVHLAGNALRSGRIADARPFVEEGEALSRKIGDLIGGLEMRLTRAKLLEAEGRIQEALLLYQQSEGAAERQERGDYRLECRLAICRIEAVNELEKACATAQSLLAEAKQTRRAQYEVQAHVLLADFHLRLKQEAPALEHALKALERAKQTGFCWFVPVAKAVLRKLGHPSASG